MIKNGLIRKIISFVSEKFGLSQPFIRYGFHLAVIILIVTGFTPIELRPTPAMIESLLTGSHKTYIPLGSEIEPFRKILPETGTIAFIMDKNIQGDQPLSEIYHSIQNYVCPLILDPKGGEPAGFLYCSTDVIANQRLLETGYQFAANLGNGKGIIIKIIR